MYCSTCGNLINGKLKYCNSCGERLVREKDEDRDGTPGKMLDNILTTICVVVVFGLGILVGLVAVLLGQDVRIEMVATLVVAYLLAVFGICFALLRQVPKLIDAKLNSRTDMPDFAPQQLKAVTTAQLEEHRERGVASVTEHTTRTLDGVLVERK